LQAQIYFHIAYYIVEEKETKLNHRQKQRAKKRQLKCELKTHAKKFKKETTVLEEEVQPKKACF